MKALLLALLSAVPASAATPAAVPDGRWTMAFQGLFDAPAAKAPAWPVVERLRGVDFFTPYGRRIEALLKPAFERDHIAPEALMKDDAWKDAKVAAALRAASRTERDRLKSIEEKLSRSEVLSAEDLQQAREVAYFGIFLLDPEQQGPALEAYRRARARADEATLAKARALSDGLDHEEFWIAATRAVLPVDGKDSAGETARRLARLDPFADKGATSLAKIAHRLRQKGFAEADALLDHSGSPAAAGQAIEELERESRETLDRIASRRDAEPSDLLLQAADLLAERSLFLPEPAQALLKDLVPSFAREIEVARARAAETAKAKVETEEAEEESRPKEAFQISEEAWRHVANGALNAAFSALYRLSKENLATFKDVRADEFNENIREAYYTPLREDPHSAAKGYVRELFPKIKGYLNRLEKERWIPEADKKMRRALAEVAMQAISNVIVASPETLVTVYPAQSESLEKLSEQLLPLPSRPARWRRATRAVLVGTGYALVGLGALVLLCLLAALISG